MTYSFGRGIPANSILRQGTLIVGVPRKKTQSQEQSAADDPMAAAATSLEAALQKKLAEVNGPSRQSASTTRKPDENT